jgi:predicted phosphodiesterase
MKIAVVSDIHGNLPALQAVAADIERRRVDQVVNLGDILSGPLMPLETAEYLMGRPDWITIAGNHERQLLKIWDTAQGRIDPTTSDGYAATRIQQRHADWLRGLPPTHWLAPDVLLVHGTPGSDLVYWMESVTPDFGLHGSLGMRPATAEEIQQRLHSGAAVQRASLVLCGHTHVPRAAQCGPALIVNPGSVGLQAYDDSHPHFHQAQNGSPHARYAVVEKHRAGWLVQHHLVPYDWEPMARLASRNGRPDWAYALTTGRMPPRASTIAP